MRRSTHERCLLPAPPPAGLANVSAAMRRFRLPCVLAACVLLAACGSKTTLFRQHTVTVGGITPQGEATAGYPLIATKNTTRIAGKDPIANATATAQASPTPALESAFTNVWADGGAQWRN